jgi:hypothetical protein
MTDIFREIDEDIRRDRTVETFRKYGSWFIAAAVLVVALTGAYRWYQQDKQHKAEIAGGQFEAALEASRAGKSAEAEALLTDLVQGAGSGYRDLARFRVASEMGLTSPEKAVKAFDELAADAQLGPLLQGLARLRAAYLVADRASRDELKARVEPLLPAGGAWGSSARELLGLKALKANDFEGAGKYFDAIMTEDAAPQALKQRAELYLSLVRGGAVSAKP